MRKLSRFQFFALASLLFILTAYSPRAEAIDPRTKAVLTMAAYGTAGGALLGTASLAFGTKGRAVAIGASLGLYAGLIFGSYIVINHRMEQYRPHDPDRNYYPDSDGFGPYESGGGGGWGDWFGGGGEYWSPAVHWSDLDSDAQGLSKYKSWGGQNVDGGPPIFINFFNYQF